MLTVNCLHDLKPFGIYPLTGEADNLSYRILCDLSKQGAKIIRDVYDMTPNNSPWNRNTDGQEHVACCMLAHHAYEDIAPIALRTKSHTVFSTGHTDGGGGHTYFGLQGDEVIEQAQWEYVDDELKQIEPPRYRGSSDSEWHRWPTCYFR